MRLPEHVNILVKICRSGSSQLLLRDFVVLVHIVNDGQLFARLLLIVPDTRNTI